MKWAEWIDAMRKLGYSDSQMASLLKKRGYKKSAIRKAFGPAELLPFFHTLFVTDMGDYFARLDTSDIRTPAALVLGNVAIASLIASLAFSLSLASTLLAGLLAAATQVLCTHAGAKLYGGRGTLRQTFFAEATAVSAEFILAALGVLLFAFLHMFSPLFAFMALLLILWVALMFSGALGYGGVQHYHELPFDKSIVSALLLPLLAIATGTVTLFIFVLFRFLSAL